MGCSLQDLPAKVSRRSKTHPNVAAPLRPKCLLQLRHNIPQARCSRDQWTLGLDGIDLHQANNKGHPKDAQPVQIRFPIFIALVPSFFFTIYAFHDKQRYKIVIGRLSETNILAR